MVERAAVNREAAGSTPALGASEPTLEDLVRAHIDAALDAALDEWHTLRSEPRGILLDGA